MSSKKERRRRSKKGIKQRRRTGALTGMRRGFKNAAHSAVGGGKRSSRKSGLLSAVLTLAVVGAAVWYLLQR